jgi:PGF-pre-PGF domain-containing protein
VDLTASGLPSGAAITFSPPTGIPSFNSTLTILTIATTPVGTYTITITGTGGGKTHACTYTLTVIPAVPIPPEIIEVESPPVEIPFIQPGVPQDVTVENTGITGLTISTLENVENVRIVVQQLTDRPATIAIGPPGIAYQYFNIVAENLSDAQVENVTIRFKIEKSWIAQNGIDIQTITLNRYDPVTEEWASLPTTFLSEDDTYAYFSAVSPGLSVFGISGQVLRPDFSIGVSPASGTVVQGGSAVATVSITSIGGFTDTVDLTASGLPSGAVATFSPTSVTPPANGTATSTLTISTSPTTPAGAYSITITGTGDGKTHTTTYTLIVTEAVVPDFSISVSPTSGSVIQGKSTSTTISVISIEGFAETVSLTASGLPSGAVATFSPLSGMPSFTSTMTISTSPTTPVGTYIITITGTGGGKTHSTTYSLTVTEAVVPPIPDFTISVGPTSGSVVQGENTSATVSVTSVEGFSETVSLSVLLPPGTDLSVSLSPPSGIPSFTSTLTISTSPTTLAGTYDIIITGTGGGKTHDCAYTLTVTVAPPKPFPWALVIGIIIAIVIVISVAVLLYRRRR